jgi:hypothetical protein
LKININGGLFYGKLLNFGYFQNCKFFIENKLEIGDAKYENICVQKFDLKVMSQK